MTHKHLIHSAIVNRFLFRAHTIYKETRNPMTIPKHIQQLVKAANKASMQCRWGYYPMAPSIGLTDKEIDKHSIAIEKHGVAKDALNNAGFSNEAETHSRIIDSHSWVVQRVGN